MKKEKVIVIGTNHAGTFAVNALADNFHDSVEVTTYDSNNNISFLACGMALWISGVVDEPSGLFYATPQGLKDKGINVYMEHLVEGVDYKNKTLKIKDVNSDKTFEDQYDKLIISVGSWPIKPRIKGIDLENVIYAKLFQHAQHAKEIIADESIKKIGVVGGGYIGIELVEAFKKNGKEALIITDECILNRYYDVEFCAAMSDNLKQNGVQVVENELVEELVGENGKVVAIKTNKGLYDVDVILMSVGFMANTKFLQNDELDVNERGVIKVNEKQETNIPDVYAIGDCATIHSNATNGEENIALASNAVRTGLVAGYNAGGYDLKMNGVQGSNAINIYGLTLVSTGLNESSAKMFGYDIDSISVTDLIRPEFMPTNNEVTIKIIWDKKTLKILGAQLMSKEDVSLAIHMFSLAIEVGYTIDKLATLDLFFLPHYNKPVNYITRAGMEALEKILKYKK